MCRRVADEPPARGRRPRRKQPRGRVSVGMAVACTSLELTDLLAEFHRQDPAVEFALTEANSVCVTEESDTQQRYPPVT